MIRSTMQDYQLTIGAIMRHGARVYPGSECVTWTGAGPRRAGYAEVAQNAARLAGALTRLGIGPNDPVGTFCWNNQEHLEAYFGVPSMGAVLVRHEALLLRMEVKDRPSPCCRSSRVKLEAA